MPDQNARRDEGIRIATVVLDHLSQGSPEGSENLPGLLAEYGLTFPDIGLADKDAFDARVRASRLTRARKSLATIQETFRAVTYEFLCTDLEAAGSGPDAIGLAPEAFAALTRQWNLAQAISALRILRSHPSHKSGQRVRRFLREAHASLKDIGTSRAELRRLTANCHE